VQIDIIISGFGGQGILFAGEILCRAAIESGLETSWFPSYGPEMRGGTAFCTVVISDEPIASPIVEYPSAVVALNLPSFIKYEKLLSSDGILIANTSLIDTRSERPDISCIYIPATEMAEDIGEKKATNIVALGALVAGIKVLDLKTLDLALKETLSGKKADLLDLNVKALVAGYEFFTNQ